MFQGEDKRALVVHLRSCIGIGSGTSSPCIDLRATYGERVERLAEFAVYEQRCFLVRANEGEADCAVFGQNVVELIEISFAFKG